MRLAEISPDPAEDLPGFLARYPALAGLDERLYVTLIRDNAHDWARGMVSRFGHLDLASWRAGRLSLEQVLALDGRPHPLVRERSALEEHRRRGRALLEGEGDPLPDSPRHLNPELLARIAALRTWPVPIVVTQDEGWGFVVEGYHRVGYLRALRDLERPVGQVHDCFVLDPV